MAVSVFHIFTVEAETMSTSGAARLPITEQEKVNEIIEVCKKRMFSLTWRSFHSNWVNVSSKWRKMSLFSLSPNNRNSANWFKPFLMLRERNWSPRGRQIKCNWKSNTEPKAHKETLWHPSSRYRLQVRRDRKHKNWMEPRRPLIWINRTGGSEWPWPSPQHRLQPT